MNRLHLLSAALIISAGLMLAWETGAQVAREAAIPLSDFPREPIVIETHSARRHTLDAWRADTPATREQGLMFVQDVQPEQAMIFVYQPPQHVAMWMKNTLLPLDMVFVDDAGCVVRIVRNAHPRSLDTIDSRTPVALVVELKGGVAKSLGIDAGDRVLRPSADWPARGLSCTGVR